METQEKLLGFDVREMWLGLSDWPQSRRDLHLIKSDIEKPLSVDTMIWQSVFDLNPAPTLPDFRGPVQFLWDDIVGMRQHFNNIASVSQPSWTIAVTAYFELLTIDEMRRWEGLDRASFNAIDYSAKFLGYD
ncbi:MAG: hypothetical protein K8I60_00125, partial [Anaerolineae bacterium]|nr:hypothetical protein [Anaerolineae bacterium]